jgi:hypothetical protein
VVNDVAPISGEVADEGFAFSDVEWGGRGCGDDDMVVDPISPEHGVLVWRNFDGGSGLGSVFV